MRRFKYAVHHYDVMRGQILSEWLNTIASKNRRLASVLYTTIENGAIVRGAFLFEESEE
jgi:hypothetical protein